MPESIDDFSVSVGAGIPNPNPTSGSLINLSNAFENVQYYNYRKKSNNNYEKMKLNIINKKLDPNKCYHKVPETYSEKEKELYKNRIFNNIEGVNNLKFEDVVFIRGVGNYLKTNKNLVVDYFDETEAVHVDIAMIFQTSYDFKNDKFENNALTHHDYENRNKSIKVFDSIGNSHNVSYKLIEDPYFKLYYNEDLHTGMFYHKTHVVNNQLHSKIQGINYDRNFNDWLLSVKNKPMTYVNTYGKKYPFGIEIETISGLMPPHLTNHLYYSSVHDGSLRHPDDGKTYGKEYVTNVLKGDLGLHQLNMLSKELRKRCLINNQCGVHVHLSDINFNQEAIVLMYYVYQQIQTEIFDILPKSRRHNEYCRVLTPINININDILNNRNYNIKKYYDQIVKVLSQKDVSGIHVNKKKDHPKGFKCGYDHSAGRYCWVNFIPSLFNTRNNGVYTIEFRSMSATLSYKKIKNWLLVCMALVDIVENHKLFIYNNNNKLTLETILEQVYGKNSKELILWVSERKNKFLKNDFKSQKEANSFEQAEYDECEINESKSLKEL